MCQEVTLIIVIKPKIKFISFIMVSFFQECLRTSTEQMLFGDRFFDFTCALCGPVQVSRDAIQLTFRILAAYLGQIHEQLQY